MRLYCEATQMPEADCRCTECLYDNETDPNYCDRCDGDGLVWGDEIASAYDFGWIDEDKLYPCPQCKGGGG